MMNFKLKTLTLCIMATITAMASAQSLVGLDMEKNFQAQVKSIDEFIQRFNGMESHPDIEASADSKTRNLVALFDYKMSHSGMTDSMFTHFVSEFVNAVEKKDAKICLTDGDMYAEADISATVCGKKASLKLFLQSQSYNKDRVRWAIVGVKGLFAANVVDTTKYYGISPVEHEIHFMGIGDIFKYNSPEMPGYRGMRTVLDELSFFLGLAMAGQVSVSAVNELTMHCVEVPGYAFTINEQGRDGRNSGWLISSLEKITDKTEYINKLLGK